MKYIINCDGMMCQFVSLPEYGDNFTYPFASQHRGSTTLLENIIDLLNQAKKRNFFIDDNYHDDEQAYSDFHGYILSKQTKDGFIVLQCIRRYSTVSINGKVVLQDICDYDSAIDALILAFKSSL